MRYYCSQVRQQLLGSAQIRGNVQGGSRCQAGEGNLGTKRSLWEGDDSPARRRRFPLPFMMCVYMGGGIPLQLTATPRPALLFLKSLAARGDWPRPGPHQPPGAGPGPHCLVWGRLDAPEAGLGQPRPGGAAATAPGGLGARPGRGQVQVPEGKRGCSPGGLSGTKPRSECHVSRNPLLTLGQHSAPARASVPPTTSICPFLGIAIVIPPTQPLHLMPPAPHPPICSFRPQFARRLMRRSLHSFRSP
jgi:hypothetical protein